MNILITICARGGSKGIPGKNIKNMAGKPLINYSIDQGVKFAIGKKCVIGLSTDSSEIIEAAKSAGLVTDYRRPEALATDTAGKLGVIADLIKFEEEKRQLKFDYIIDLDVTSPLRTNDDIEAALQIIMEDEHAINIFSVNPANRNPYFNMVEKNKEGYYELCKKGDFITRQSAPKVYDMNASFYVYRRNFFDTAFSSAITSRSLIYEMPHICFDLDHPIDFEFMEYLLENQKLDFLV